MQRRIKLAIGLLITSSWGMLPCDVSPWQASRGHAGEYAHAPDYEHVEKYAHAHEYHYGTDYNPHIGPPRACDGASHASACDEMICDEFGCDSGALKRKHKSQHSASWVDKVWSKVAFWKK